MNNDRTNLDVKDLTVTLSSRDIVRDVTLRVENDQFVGIIGPNGCGKSTLLRSVYKVLRPSCGEIFLNGQDLLHMSEKAMARRMAVVSQFNELQFDFSAMQIVMLGRAPHKRLFEGDTQEDVQLALRALDMVGMRDMVDRSYSSLSGGEKQRIVLARAIAQSPSFLVLDEPTNHLDIKYQLQIMKTVKELGVGVLAALHDLTLASDYCDHIYLMKGGKIITHGTPEEVITQENISELYDIDCRVYPNPINGKIAITFLY